MFAIRWRRQDFIDPDSPPTCLLALAWAFPQDRARGLFRLLRPSAIPPQGLEQPQQVEDVIGRGLVDRAGEAKRSSREKDLRYRDRQ